MDLEVLVYIAIAAFYILSQLTGGKKKKRGAQRPSKQPARPSPQRQVPDAEPVASSAPSNELDEALREIRRALGWAQPEPEPERTPAPVPVPERTVAAESVPDSRPIPPAEIEKVRSRPVPKSRLETIPSEPIEARSVESSTSWHGERIDPTPAPATVAAPRTARSARLTTPVRVASLPRSTERPKQVQQPVNKKLESIRSRLSDPASAREAFLMSEIFNRRF